MKTVLKFVMLVVAMSLCATIVMADAPTTPKDMTVSCKKPTPDRQPGLVRYKGDTNQWMFRLVLSDGAHLVGEANWDYPDKGTANSDWGMWSFGEGDTDRMALIWSSPNTTGEFHVTVSGKITCGTGGNGEPIDFEAGWDGEIPSITGVTVTSGATQTHMKQDYPNAGDQNWGCVKSAGEYVEVKATTGPNDDESVWDEISWNGGEEVPGKTNNYRRFSRDSSAKFEVKPTIDGKGPKPLCIWVIWGTYSVKWDEETNSEQVCEKSPFSVVNGEWRDVYGRGTQLGPINYCQNSLLTTLTAARIQCTTQLFPPGIGDIVTVSAGSNPHWWMNRRAYGNEYLNGEFVKSWAGDDTSQLNSMDLNPSGNKGKDKLFDIDGAGPIVLVKKDGETKPHLPEYPYIANLHTVEYYMDFEAWASVVLDTVYDCTDKVQFSCRSRINYDILNVHCPTFEENSLSFGWTDLKSKY